LLHEIMIKGLFIGLLAGHVAAAPTEPVEVPGSFPDNFTSDAIERGRELFPIYAISNKCARYCSARDAARPSIKAIEMSVKGTAQGTAGPVKALEMLALNENLDTVVQSNSMCTRRSAMAKAAGLAAGLSLGAVSAPGFAAETKKVKMGTDSAQLIFVPDELKICKGDSVTWVNNKGGPHNVVFETVPSGVDSDKISMEEQLGDEGETYTLKFDVPGNYEYYCEPHAGAGMKANLFVE